MRLLAVLVLALGACDMDCPVAPEEYKGARLTGCSGRVGYDEVACCSYESARCSYVLCASDCGDWSEESWGCY